MVNEILKTAIIAGGGQLPRQVAEACQAQGIPYIIIAFHGQTDSSWLPAHPHVWMYLGAVGDTLIVLREQDVKQVVMAGKIQRPSWSELKLDMTGAAWLASGALAALGDDGLLKLIATKLEAEGLTLRSAQDICGDRVLAPSGVWGQHAPTAEALEDIQHGKRIIQGIYGQLDIGQAVVVQQGLVLGVEAIEGTDQLVQRCASLKREGPGPILIKMAKPGQDERVDLPTIGMNTLQFVHQGGYQGIAVEAGRTLVIDQSALVKQADELGLFLYGIS